MEPSFVPPSTGSTLVFLAIVGAVVALFVLGVRRAASTLEPEAVQRHTLAAVVGAALWLAGTGAYVQTGLIGRGDPWVMAFMGSANVGAVALALSPVGGRLARGVPLAWLVGFQAFRLPLEVVLHDWAEQGSIPWVMTWSGRNLDVVAGVVSLAAGLWLARRPSPAVAWGATVVSLGLLLNVIYTALGAAPLPVPWAFHSEPPLWLVFYLPYAWIVTVCVAGAMAGHLVTIRALLTTRT